MSSTGTHLYRLAKLSDMRSMDCVKSLVVSWEEWVKGAHTSGGQTHSTQCDSHEL